MSDRDDPATRSYRNPPIEHRFRKGVSGNTKGRPRKKRAFVSTKVDGQPGIGFEDRIKLLAIEEAYRLITIREGDRCRANLRRIEARCPARRRSIGTLEAWSRILARSRQSPANPGNSRITPLRQRRNDGSDSRQLSIQSRLQLLEGGLDFRWRLAIALIDEQSDYVIDFVRNGACCHFDLL